ncbi:YlmC/YmxH family sporulation protein [Pseudogracilibacillus sp. SE30717A]|uniref:YlmC/YmxH family sporulation protein n=1 Tax=Pseudogracilibacillus sp. SE30717A TaxID=3098293 RepID=UPI00300DCE92
MRFKDISGKEIISINTGERLGVLGQTDLQINTKTGKIESFIVPTYKWFGLKKEETESIITWEMIKKIGQDIILIEFEE